MTNNIIKAFTSPQELRSKNVTQLLEALLVRAKNNEIDGLAIVMITPEGDTQLVISNDVDIGKAAQGADLLHFTLNKSYLSTAEEVTP